MFVFLVDGELSDNILSCSIACQRKAKLQDRPLHGVIARQIFEFLRIKLNFLN